MSDDVGREGVAMAVPVRGGAGASAARQGQQERAAEVARQHRRALRVLPVVTFFAVLLGASIASVSAWWLGSLFGLAVFGGGVARVYQRTTVSWTVGAAGERRTARMLAVLARDGWVVLHDRAIPGSRANLDHLLIGPAGVFYADSKNWGSKKSELRLRGGELWYGRHPQTKMLQMVRWEAEQASRTLGVPVEAFVVVHQAKVPGGVVMLEGVTVIPAKRLRHAVRNRAPQHGFDPARVQQLALQAEAAFPPAL
jgi:hypothetical protein